MHLNFHQFILASEDKDHGEDSNIQKLIEKEENHKQTSDDSTKTSQSNVNDILKGKFEYLTMISTISDRNANLS